MLSIMYVDREGNCSNLAGCRQYMSLGHYHVRLPYGYTCFNILHWYCE